jgi:hypothetical protein
MPPASRMTSWSTSTDVSGSCKRPSPLRVRTVRVERAADAPGHTKFVTASGALHQAAHLSLRMHIAPLGASAARWAAPPGPVPAPSTR